MWLQQPGTAAHTRHLKGGFCSGEGRGWCRRESTRLEGAGPAEGATGAGGVPASPVEGVHSDCPYGPCSLSPVSFVGHALPFLCPAGIYLISETRVIAHPSGKPLPPSLRTPTSELPLPVSPGLSAYAMTRTGLLVDLPTRS